MQTFLFDASAVVEKYAPTNERNKRVLDKYFSQKFSRKAQLYIPNFCIAEVFNALARKHFKPTERDVPLDFEEYTNCLKKFRSHIHWGRTLYPYDLNRYHIVAADNIIPVEHRLASLKGDHLSTFDILVIAMACELTFPHGSEDTFLVTCDLRIKRVVDMMRGSDFSGDMVEGPLGELDKKRWSPPLCLYVPYVGQVR